MYRLQTGTAFIINRTGTSKVNIIIPESVVEIISLIGEQETQVLIKAFGGNAVFFPKNPDRPSVVSKDSWAKLCKRFGGNPIFIPRCYKTLLHNRNLKIKSDRETLTMNQLTQKYQLTDRQIFTILGKEVNTSQSDLF